MTVAARRGVAGGPADRWAARHPAESPLAIGPRGGEPGAPGCLRLELQMGEGAGAAGSGDVLQESAERCGRALAVGGARSGGGLGGEREVLLLAALGDRPRTASRVGR
ncbi:hypothetical protein HFP43_10095 [Streptomyces sp. SJ1-7]|nr:hypothetical protein [Streptomyces sp. SJ1-7]